MKINKLTNRLFETVSINGSTDFLIRSLGSGHYSVSWRQLDEGRMTPEFRAPEMETKKNVKFNAEKPEDLLKWLTSLGLTHHLIEINAAAEKLAERERQAFGRREKFG